MADRTQDRPRTYEVDSVLAACRLLVSISVQSLTAVQDDVNMTQLRILVVVASQGTSTLSDLAAGTGMHLSSASRMCDRLVRDGLLARADDPADRRSLQLTLTARGAAIVGEVARARRRAITPVLRRLDPDRRGALVELLEEFTAAGGEPAHVHLWALGWAT